MHRRAGAVPPLPQLGRDVRSHRRQHQQHGVDGEVGGAVAVHQVGELHQRRHRRVVRPTVVVVGHAGDEAVGGLVDDGGAVAGGGRHRIRLGIGQPPHAGQKTAAAVDADRLPVDIVGRRADEQM